MRYCEICKSSRACNHGNAKRRRLAAALIGVVAAVAVATAAGAALMPDGPTGGPAPAWSPYPQWTITRPPTLVPVTRTYDFPPPPCQIPPCAMESIRPGGAR